MKPLKLFLAVLLALTLLVGMAGTAVADKTQFGYFQVKLLGWDATPGWDGQLNSGFQSTWFAYPQPAPPTQPPPPTWWNEWFYDGKLVIPGGKFVNVVFDWLPINPGIPSNFHVTINWSTAGWQPGQGTPPVPITGAPDPEQYIGRSTPYVFQYIPDPTGANPPVLQHFQSGDFWLPIPYNPEWVSIDVRGENVFIMNGILEHTCVPIPGALWLLGPGLLGLLGIRWKMGR